jgi:hypothetical protein
MITVRDGAMGNRAIPDFGSAWSGPAVVAAASPPGGTDRPGARPGPTGGEAPSLGPAGSVEAGADVDTSETVAANWRRNQGPTSAQPISRSGASES